VNRSVARVFAATAATVGAAVLATPVLAAGSPGWQLSESWPTDSVVQDITATSATNAWAIGNVPKGPTLVAQVQEWNGTAWQTVALPAGFDANGTLGPSEIAATSASDMWVTTSNPNGNSSLLHWTGKSWNHVQIFPSHVNITDVIAGGPAGYWAFGQANNSNAAWHFNGTSWVQSAVPAFVKGSREASQAQGTIWAENVSGAGVIAALDLYHSSGGTWTGVPAEGLGLPKGAAVTGQSIVALGSANVWVSLRITGSNHASWGLLLHYDGGKWSRVTAPAMPGVVENLVTADGSGSIWYQAQASNKKSSYAWHYVSGKWVQYSLPVTKGWASDQMLSAALVPGTTSVWLAGEEVNNAAGFSGTGPGMILAYHG
jgi:hypothetical protein